MTRTAVAELWHRIEPILDAALELPPELWPAYLDKACGAGTPLRGAVERLLVSANDPAATTENEIGAVAWAQPMLIEREAAAPTRIGPYVIHHVLGRGGMGSVYLASRDDTEGSPRVALKVMRNGLDQDRVLLRRFTDERQMLATLQHPGIARMLEGGVTGDGHPWFAMEFVDGVPLNRYVETYAPALNEKLQLFLQIVEAVSYSHRNLIVHRDLKPANILVTAAGTIKLLDFGIAKLLAPSGAGDASITRTGFQPFTPEYASPEQVLGEPVTTSADVYALGVVLYELLTGERPLSLARTSPAHWARVIRESTPRAPSVVVGDGRALRGDLDAIALTALRREPDRRYASADRLGDDVRRHLEQRPVLARADGGLYRTRKFLRQQRAAVITATIIAIGLLAFGAVARSRSANMKRESDRTPTMQTALGHRHLHNDDLERAERSLHLAVTRRHEYGREEAPRRGSSSPTIAVLAVAATGTPHHRALSRPAEPLTRAQVIARLDSASDEHPASFVGEDLSALDLSGLDFKRANLSHARLAGTRMMNAKMFAVNFDSAFARGADLSGATMDVSTMRSTDFTHATLRGASMYAVIMPQVNFTDADLSRVRIIGLASGAIFVRAKLDHADLGADPRNQPMGVMRTDFSASDFSGADLTDANLRKAKLTRANLTGANLTGCDLSLAEISGATFHQIVGRDAIKGLDQAKYRDEATFDPR